MATVIIVLPTTILRTAAVFDMPRHPSLPPDLRFGRVISAFVVRSFGCLDFVGKERPPLRVIKSFLLALLRLRFTAALTKARTPSPAEDTKPRPARTVDMACRFLPSFPAMSAYNFHCVVSWPLITSRESLWSLSQAANFCFPLSVFRSIRISRRNCFAISKTCSR